MHASGLHARQDSAVVQYEQTFKTQDFIRSYNLEASSFFILQRFLAVVYCAVSRLFNCGWFLANHICRFPFLSAPSRTASLHLNFNLTFLSLLPQQSQHIIIVIHSNFCRNGFRSPSYHRRTLFLAPCVWRCSGSERVNQTDAWVNAVSCLLASLTGTPR